MAHIRIVDEAQARGSVAEDYAFISGSYSKRLGARTPTRQIYRVPTGVPRRAATHRFRDVWPTIWAAERARFQFRPHATDRAGDG